MAVLSSGSEPGVSLSPFSILLPRYGTDQHHQWSQWRKTGEQYSNPRICQLELRSSCHLSGYTSYWYGTLYSICIRNLENGEVQEVGWHEPESGHSLIVAPPLSVESKLHLTHLSGDQRNMGDWSICFNLS